MDPVVASIISAAVSEIMPYLINGLYNVLSNGSDENAIKKLNLEDFFKIVNKKFEHDVEQIVESLLLKQDLRHLKPKTINSI